MAYEDYLLANYATNLLGYYKLGDTASPAVDASASGFNSVAVGTSVTFGQSNKITNTAANSVLLGGTSAQTFIQLESSPGSRFRVTTYTLGIWFKRAGAGVTGSTGTGGITAEPLVAKGGAESETSGLNCNFAMGLEAIDSSLYLSADYEKDNSGNLTNSPTGRNGRMLDCSVASNVFTLLAHTQSGASAVAHTYANGERVRFGGTAITGVTAGTWYFLVSVNQGAGTFQIATTNGGSALTGLGTVAAGGGAWFNHAKATVLLATSSTSWHSAFCTWDGTNLKTYLDGVLAENEVPTMLPPENTSTQLAAIAAFVTSAAARTGAFNGNVQHVSIWNAALSGANVLDLHNVGLLASTTIAGRAAVQVTNGTTIAGRGAVKITNGASQSGRACIGGVPSGLAHYWPNNEDSISRVDRVAGLDLIQQNGTVQNSPGIHRGAANFSIVDAAYFKTASNLAFATDNSLGIWVYFRSLPVLGQFYTLTHCDDAPDSLSLGLTLDHSGNLQVSDNAGGSASAALGALNAWHLIVAVFPSGGTIKISVDNATFTAGSALDHLANGHLFVGDPSPTVPDGLIGPIFIFNRALPQGDVGALWNAGAGVFREDATISGRASISTSTTAGITVAGRAHTQATLVATQAGRASVQATVGATIAGRAAVKVTNGITIAGRANVPFVKSFQEGDANSYASTQDTFLDTSTPDQDNSNAVSLVADFDSPSRDRVILLRFDSIFGSGANQIPFGAKITKVSLQLYINTEGQELGAHRMLIPWTEASTHNTLTGGVSLNDVDAKATADITTDVLDDGTTTLDAFVGSRTLSSAETKNTGVNVPGAGLITTVQAWADGGNNYGWLLTSHTQQDGLQIDSSEGATQARHPKLIVEYTIPHSSTTQGGRAAVRVTNGTTIAGRAAVKVTSGTTIAGRAAVGTSGGITIAGRVDVKATVGTTIAGRASVAGAGHLSTSLNGRVDVRATLSSSLAGKATVGPLTYRAAIPYTSGAWYRGVPPQFLRPVSDVNVGNWGAAPLWSKINEEQFADDATKIGSPVNPASESCEVALAPIADPNTSVNHKIRYRFQKVDTGPSINVTVSLIEGTTIIASRTHTNVANGFTLGEFNLTPSEVDSIEDYADLRLRFTAN